MRPSLPRRRWARAALVLVVVGAAFALVWWRGPSLDLLRGVFTAVGWHWVAMAIGLSVASVAVRAAAWQAVIDQAMPPPRPLFRTVLSAFSIGALGNAALPGRIGELARVAVLVNRSPRRGGTWATFAGTVFAHRVLDLVAVGFLVVYVAAAAEIPGWAQTSLLALVAAGVVLLGASVAWARHHEVGETDGIGRVRRLVTMGRQGLGVMRVPLHAVGATFLQMLGWACQLFAVYAAMRAFQIEEALVAAGVVVLVTNVALVFPLWPGNVGLFQAAVALALVPYGIAYAHGFAFGLGLQAIEVAVAAALGLFFLAREGLSFAMLRRMPAEEPAAV